MSLCPSFFIAAMLARDNPYSTHHVLAFRYRPQDWTWDEMFARLQKLNYRGAIVGPEGAGKSTLLQDLAHPLRQRGFNPIYLFLNRQRRGFSRRTLSQLFKTCSAKDIICFDGSEQLGLARWLWFRWRTRRAGGLIVTIHKPGRLPTLVVCKTHVCLLREMVVLLGEDDPPDDAFLDDLYQRHDGNLREAIRELYDRWAKI